MSRANRLTAALHKLFSVTATYADENTMMAFMEGLNDCEIADIEEACMAVGKVKADTVRLADIRNEIVELRRSRAVSRYVRPQLPAPEVSDERIIAAIENVVRVVTSKRPDPKNWAREILREAGRGTYKSYYGIKLAREALGASVDHEAELERLAIQEEGR